MAMLSAADIQAMIEVTVRGALQGQAAAEVAFVQVAAVPRSVFSASGRLPRRRRRRLPLQGSADRRLNHRLDVRGTQHRHGFRCTLHEVSLESYVGLRYHVAFLSALLRCKA